MPACGQHKSRTHESRAVSSIDLNNFQGRGLAIALRNEMSWRAPMELQSPHQIFGRRYVGTLGFRTQLPRGALPHGI